MSRRSSGAVTVFEDEKKSPDLSRNDLRLVPWSVQPPSKTAIFHIDYHIGDTAVLCVLPIKVSTRGKADSSFVPVTSRKLRRDAITEYLKMQMLSKTIAIHLAQKTIQSRETGIEDAIPIDQLVFFESDKSYLQGLSDGVKTSFKLKTTVATVKTSEDKKSGVPIYCSLDFNGLKELSATDPDNVEYWNKLQILLRKVTETSISNSTDKTTRFCLGTGSLLREASKTTDSFTTKFNDKKVTLREASKVNVLFRTMLKLDPNDRKIHVETDLVPGVKGGTFLSKLMISVFGLAMVDQDNEKLLAKAKAMIIGLRVIRTYSRMSEATSRTKAAATGLSHENGPISNSPDSKSRALTDITTSTKSAAAGTNKQISRKTTEEYFDDFPASTIVDVKRASEIPDFWKDGVRYSAVKYLKTYYKQAQSLNFPNMPLANVGKDSWVPLELLKTVGISTDLQQIPSVGQMTASLKERLDNYNLDANKDNLQKAAAELMENMRKSHDHLSKILSDEEYISESFIHSPLAVNHVARERSKIPQPGTGIKYGIIYVQPKGIRSDTSEEFAKSVAELLNAHGKLANSEKIVDIDKSFNTLVAVVPNIKPLLLPPSEQYPEVQAFYNSGPDTIIAIIDDRGRSKQHVHFIRSELQKFGNRKVGAVVQCFNRIDLEVRPGRSMHLPIGALQRINVMHGNKNFVVQGVPELPDRRLMIVGAHISHPGSGAATSCPSVASLVGSVDEDLMQYPGSARLQPTLKAAFWRNNPNLPKLKHEVESQILDLKSMMMERIEAWVNKQGKAHAPHIVFYRHSNQAYDEDVIQKEITEIQQACTEFTDWQHTKITFSYVLVNKNADAHSPYQAYSKAVFDKSAKNKFNITECGQKGVGYKYQYHVQNVSEQHVLSIGQHRTLTRHLNANYQLGKNDNIAIALPVHFAQKLAKRMYDYFRFAVTNQYDSLSSVLRRLEYPDEKGAENDKQMTEMMNEYLLHYGVAQAASPSELSEAPLRKNPWLENLDDKMFYI